MIKVISRLKRIIQRMIYLFRIRKLIKITLEEYGRISAEDRNNREPWHHYPRDTWVLKRFKVFRKKRKDKIFSYVVNIAESDKYIKTIPYPSQGIRTTLPPSIAVTRKGIKFLTPTVFINTLVGAVAPILSLLISATALVVAVIALSHK